MRDPYSMALCATIFTLFLLGIATSVQAKVTVTSTSTAVTIANDRVTFAYRKATGDLYNVALDGTNLLGTYTKTDGRGYLVCYCVIDQPKGYWTVGGDPITTTYDSITGTDSAGIQFGGVVISQTIFTNQTFQHFHFLRDGETGIHSFVRLRFQNDTLENAGQIGEFRFLFRPGSGNLWTHLSTNSKTYAPLPLSTTIANEIEVQDATWYIGNATADPYVQSFSEYFTKYQFSADYGTNLARGLYSDGTKTNGTAYGAWLVLNTKDTYFGGPTRSDLAVDGSIYNKYSTTHYGGRTPKQYQGWERTWGPQFLYFNSGKGKSLSELRNDAEKLAFPEWNARFYDDIARYVPGYFPTSSRGNITGTISLQNPSVLNVLSGDLTWVVLSQNGVRFPDNVGDSKARQYFIKAKVATDGLTATFNITRVVAGTYRLTVYSLGIFGEYVQDSIVVTAGGSKSLSVKWVAESHGQELWRIGQPDFSSGEFRNGYELDLSKSLHPEKYRNYWGAWDFPTDFPNSVNYTVGKSDWSRDWNYIHWAMFGPSYTRKTASFGVNKWKIHFNLAHQPDPSSNFTLTIQLAGAKGSVISSNSTDGKGTYIGTNNTNIAIAVSINNSTAPSFVWGIDAGFSSSCGVRSQVSCYTLRQLFAFSGKVLVVGWNWIELALPYGETSYVQYDALRLESNV
ncbi:rhamnogalacturonan lyase [Cladochytrium replicatum]|nr:rhamnogalacturonan lyase [Cladochytrium replicatum]